jgi:hypothetical protein
MGVGTALFEKRSYDRRGCEGRAGLSHEAESRASSTSQEAIRVMEQLFLLWTDLKLDSLTTPHGKGPGRMAAGPFLFPSGVLR